VATAPAENSRRAAVILVFMSSFLYTGPAHGARSTGKLQGRRKISFSSMGLNPTWDRKAALRFRFLPV